METTIKIELPLNRVPRNDKFRHLLPLKTRLTDWLFYHTCCGIGEFGGSRMNRTHRFYLFRYRILTIHRNQYHDRSDKERADEYLKKWSECEKELKMFRLAALGEGVADDVKKVIRESWGVDLDEGTVR